MSNNWKRGTIKQSWLIKQKLFIYLTEEKVLGKGYPGGHHLGTGVIVSHLERVGIANWKYSCVPHCETYRVPTHSNDHDIAGVGFGEGGGIGL